MKKIPTLFVRDYETIITGFEPIAASTNVDGSQSIAHKVTESKKGRFLATNQITPGCEWVINGEGIATRKWDGTCCKVENGILYKRYDAKHGKTPPEGFIPAQEPDPITGHWPGWLKINPNDPANRWHIEALGNTIKMAHPNGLPDGSYELVGPKINGNRDNIPTHQWIRHGSQIYPDAPRDFEGLKRWFTAFNLSCEGIVFHHPDGRMCKIKRSDFGLKW
jgi:hypothetical protein